MWFPFALLTAGLETAKDVAIKKSSLHVSPLLVSVSLQLFAALVLFPLVVVIGLPQIKVGFWVAMMATAVLGPAWSWFYTRALAASDVSKVVPMLAFNPIFTALLSIFFDRRWPSSLGWVAIFLVGIGLYVLRLDVGKGTKAKTMLQPFTSVWHEPGARYMLGVALLWSVGAHISKLAVINSSPLFAAASFCSVSAAVLLAFGFFTKQVTNQQPKSYFFG